MKNRIRLNEAQLHNVIKESVKNVLNEISDTKDTLSYRNFINNDGDATNKWIDGYNSEMKSWKYNKVSKMYKHIENKLKANGINIPFVVTDNNWWFEVMVPASAIKELTNDVALSYRNDLLKANPNGEMRDYEVFKLMGADLFPNYKKGGPSPYDIMRMPRFSNNVVRYKNAVLSLKDRISKVYPVERISHTTKYPWDYKGPHTDFIVFCLRNEGELKSFHDDLYYSPEAIAERRREEESEQQYWNNLYSSIDDKYAIEYDKYSME